MTNYVRVHKLLCIPVLDENGRQILEAQVEGRMVLPLSLSVPIKGDENLGSNRYFLTLSHSPGDNSELVYLHEQVPVA